MRAQPAESGDRMSRRTENKDGQPRGRLLSSGVFKKLFGTYTGIILLILAVIMGWYLVQYRQESRMMKERDWSQRAAAWGTWMDQQLMQAESLCAAVNASYAACGEHAYSCHGSNNACCRGD